LAYTEKRGRGGSVYWIARYSDGQGRWPTVKDTTGRALRFKTRREADKAGEDEEAKVRGGTWHDPDAGRETFGAFARDWFASDTVQDLAARTIGNYQVGLETILLPEFEHDALADITPGRVGTWQGKLRAAGFSEESIRTYRGLLSVILADAVEAKKIEINPVTRPRGRGRRSGKMKHRAPEKPVTDPLGALLLAERCAIMSGRDDEFVLTVTLAWTGLRWGEAVGLERPFFRMSSIRVEHQLTELDDGTWLKCPPKEDSRRDVDLPAFLSGLLSRQVAVTQTDRQAVCSCYRPGKATASHPGGGYVFTGRTTNRREGKKLVPVTAAHWRRSGFESMVFKPAAEGWFPRKAPLDRRPVPVTAEPWPGLPVRGRNYVERSQACWTPICNGLTPHLLRHSHKTWMVEDRIPEALSHDVLGHELEGVGRRYTFITDAMRAERVEALTERWNRALDARIVLNPRSPVAVLDELLLARAARVKAPARGRARESRRLRGLG
jgi:integrase